MTKPIALIAVAVLALAPIASAQTPAWKPGDLATIRADAPTDLRGHDVVLVRPVPRYYHTYTRQWAVEVAVARYHGFAEESWLVPRKPVHPTPQSPHVGEPGGSVAPPTPIVNITPTQPPTDPYGFGVWLNGVRARHGLRPLAHDPSLSHHAAINSSMGFDHAHVAPARRQNAGMGALATVCPAWLASPAHASAIFDPTVTTYGIACVNGVWTANFR